MGILFLLMKIPILIFLAILSTGLTLGIEQYRMHIHNKNFVPNVKEPL